MPARTLKTSTLMVLLALQTYGQAPSATPKFEVASLKPALSPMQLREKGLPPKQPINNPSRFEMYNVSMRVLLRQVYQLDEYQQLQAPGWIDKEFLSVVAKLPNGAKQEQAPEMLRALLAERCKLAAHWENAEGTGFILSVGKDGPKLKKTPADEGPNTNWPVPLSGNGSGEGIDSGASPVFVASTAEGSSRRDGAGDGGQRGGRLAGHFQSSPSCGRRSGIWSSCGAAMRCTEGDSET